MISLEDSVFNFSQSKTNIWDSNPHDKLTQYQ